MNMILRVYTEQKPSKKDNNSKVEIFPNLLNYLVLDCETTNNQFQNLTFGSFRAYENNILIETAIFYNPRIVNDADKAVLSNFCKNKHMKLMTLDKFVKQFYHYVLDRKFVCVGHNLAFDISRLINRWSYTKIINKGNFSLILTKNTYRPRIKTNRGSEGKIFLEFSKQKNRNAFSGYFIDTAILGSAMLDTKKPSLNKLLEVLGFSERKKEVEEHGKIYDEYIEYNSEDVHLTKICYIKLIEEYKKFDLLLQPTKVQSSASIGKAVLRKMNIQPFMQLNKTITPEMLGYLMSAFCGGRSECTYRKTPVKTTVLDFTSMYPSLNSLMHLKNFLIAKTIETKDDTIETQKLLDTITLEDLYDKTFWPKLTVLCKIKPNNDCLPVRANYNNELSNQDKNQGHHQKRSKIPNIGINYLTSNQELYFFLPDLIFSKIITGKAPKILQATRFIPTKQQQNLKEIKLFGLTINPYKDDFFKILVEQKEKIKKDSPNQAKGLKIISSATGYGIFLEVNPSDKPEQLTIYSNKTFTSKAKREIPGEYFNPIIGASLVSGARLLLGMAEAELKKIGKHHFAADTDSMFLPPETANDIQNKFQKLSPYNENIKFFKKEIEDVWLYTISTKRYVLFNKEGNQITPIEEVDEKTGKVKKIYYKLHGLGYILNPFGKEVKWQKKVWTDILKIHYGLTPEEEISEEYRDYYKITQQTITSYEIAKRFKPLNENKPFEKKIKPFNFMLCGYGRNKDIKPIAPFTKDYQSIVYQDFTDYKSIKTLNGTEYWQTMEDFLTEYMNHPESKFDGDKGLLTRKHLTINEISYCGKETKNIEQQTISEQKIEHYGPNMPDEELLKLTWPEAKKLGIPKSSYFYKRAHQQSKNLISKPKK